MTAKQTVRRKTAANLRQTRAIAQRFAEQIRRLNGAAVLFKAPMGAGKTTFISYVIKNLNRDIRVSSPTFAIINKYAENIYHADLYRVPECDIENTGIYDIIADPKNFVFVEWADNLKIKNAIHIKINILGDGSREFEIKM
jgi:tRNA threonylcarbamoyladenosine biosynthesis protein TsaE